MNNSQQILVENMFQKIIEIDLFNQLTEYTNVNEVLMPSSTIYKYLSW